MGRKCEKCYDRQLGYCPLDFICKIEPLEAFGKLGNYSHRIKELHRFAGVHNAS